MNLALLIYEILHTKQGLPLQTKIKTKATHADVDVIFSFMWFNFSFVFCTLSYNTKSV